MIMATSDRELFKEICEIECGNSSYCNILAQIVSCYKNTRGNIVLRVWDGTRNLQKTFISLSRDLTFIYGDEKKEKLIAEQMKLYDVICYDEHARNAANLNAGDYIALINLHFYTPTNCFLPSLVMHGGDGKIRNGIRVTGAGRKVVKVTKEISEAAYNCIDELIKEHEASLLPMEEEEINKSVEAQVNPSSSLNAEEDSFDEEWIDPIEIQTTNSSPKNSAIAVTVSAQTTTQPPTSNLSKDGSTQINAILFPLNESIEIPTKERESSKSVQTQVHPSSPSNAEKDSFDEEWIDPVEIQTTNSLSKIPSKTATVTVGVQTTPPPLTTNFNQHRSTQINAILSQYPSNKNAKSPTNLSNQNNQNPISPQVAKKPMTTVFNSPSTSAIRRPLSVAFPEIQQLTGSRPSKYSCIHGATANVEENDTQALFDKLKSVKPTQEEEDEKEDIEISILEEEEVLGAITDTQMEKMWEVVENAELQSSFPTSQFY